MDKLQHITNLIEEAQREAVRCGRESYVESYRLAKTIAELLAPRPTVKVDLQDVRNQSSD